MKMKAMKALLLCVLMYQMQMIQMEVTQVVFLELMDQGVILQNSMHLPFGQKASQGVVIGEIGYGQDFGLNQYQVNETNVTLSTNWVKYVIPIPDPSKLFDERGMFWYSAGTQNTGGSGYTFWIDELKFEKLGTIGQPRPAIANGQDIVQDAFAGINLEVTGLTQTFNLGSGLNKNN